MKKLLIILLSVFLLGNTFAQGSLSGEVIVTNPKKLVTPFALPTT